MLAYAGVIIQRLPASRAMLNLRPRGQLKAITILLRHSASARPCQSAAALPLQPETTAYLRNLENGAEIFLVGTAHVSKASSDEVQSMIRAVKPRTVFVELDKARAMQLMRGQEQQGSLKDFFAKMAQGTGLNIPQDLLKQGLAGFYRMLKTMGMDPGAEFKIAMEEAQRLNARIVYGDQDQSVTVKNLTNALSFMDAFKLLTGQGIAMDEDMRKSFEGSDRSNLAASIEAMKTRRASQLMTKALRQFNPKLAKALIDDRDEYMIQQLRKLDGSIVGVVGLGHLDGMEKRWAQLGGQTMKLAT